MRARTLAVSALSLSALIAATPTIVAVAVGVGLGSGAGCHHPTGSAGDVPPGPTAILTEVPPTHLATSAACPADRPAGAVCTDCQDSQCTAGHNGRCSKIYGGTGPSCYCTYDQCVTNADCSAGQVCMCQGAQGRDQNVCVPASCQNDADCPGHQYCMRSTVSLGGAHYECTTQSDQCRDDADCAKYDVCMWDATTQRHVCHPQDWTD
jgi:hypothetical protein